MECQSRSGKKEIENQHTDNRVGAEAINPRQK